MNQHVKILGIAFIVYGVMGLLPIGFIVLFLVGPGMISGDMQAMAVLSTIALVVSSILLILSLPEIIAGVWLMQYKQWARWLTIVLAVLNLLAFPIGTALGIYALWVLLNGETAALFESGGQVRVSTQAG